MLTCLITLLALASIAWTVAPSTSPTTSPSTDLRVTTFNVRLNVVSDLANAWPRRKDFAVATIRAADPDVLGLQEVLEGQRVDLVAALPEYTAIGVGREDGKAKGEYALLMVRTSRFDVVRSGTFWLSPTPEVVASKGWDANLERVATWAVLRDKTDGREVAVLNAHFDHIGKQARAESAKLLAARAEALAEGERPVVITGDFNCHDDEPPIAALAAGFVDAYRAVHPTPADDEATFHSFGGKALGRRIDYVFTRGLTPVAATIDRRSDGGRFPSDHFPLNVVLRTE